MAAVMKLSSKEMDEFTTIMSDKLILTLSKYLFKAFELIGQDDKQLINIVENGQHLLKVQLKIKAKMGNCCILKAQFEKNQII